MTLLEKLQDNITKGLIATRGGKDADELMLIVTNQLSQIISDNGGIFYSEPGEFVNEVEHRDITKEEVISLAHLGDSNMMDLHSRMYCIEFISPDNLIHVVDAEWGDFTAWDEPSTIRLEDLDNPRAILEVAKGVLNTMYNLDGIKEKFKELNETPKEELLLLKSDPKFCNKGYQDYILELLKGI